MKGFTHEHGTLTQSLDQETWLTPPHILQALGAFDLDPCAAPLPRPWATAKKHYALPEMNGLSKPWTGRIWLNPPYGLNMKLWLNRLALHGNGVALIYVRTDTDIWQKIVFSTASAIFFLKRRLFFYKKDGHRKQAAPAPSALVAFGKKNSEALKKSGLKGTFIGLKA